MPVEDSLYRAPLYYADPVVGGIDSVLKYVVDFGWSRLSTRCMQPCCVLCGTSVAFHDHRCLGRFLVSSRALEVDSVVTSGLRATVRDVVAHAIQRGRDHGITDYNSLRTTFGLSNASYAALS